MGPPENEVPIGVPISAVLGRTGDVAVALMGAQAYSSGVTLQVAVRLRREPAGPLRSSMHDLIDGRGGADDVDQRLLLGLEYSDGRIATNLGGLRRLSGLDEDRADDVREPVLIPNGGGGGDRHWDQTYWLSPSPPSGPLTVVCTWTAFAVAETLTVLDGAAFAEASSRSEVLWPWEPEEQQEQPTRPARPATGWFAGAGRRHRDHGQPDDCV